MITRETDADVVEVSTLRVKNAADLARRRFHLESAGGTFVLFGPGDAEGTTVLEWLEERIEDQGLEPTVVSTWHRITYIEAPA